MLGNLTLSVQIQGPAGWIELEDPANGYEVHKDTRAEQAVTWRRENVDSPYVEGTFTNMAVKENVTETVAIYVEGADPLDFAVKLKAVTDALSQLRFQMTWTVGNVREFWNCMVADYTIQTPQEMLFATMGVVRASVPRLPSTVLEKVV